MSILPQPNQLGLFARHLLDTVLPCSCLLCGDASAKDLLCAACRSDLPPLPAALCPQCSEQTTHGERCGRCLHTPPHFDGCLALFRYDFPVDRIIQALKYGHQLAVAPWLADQLADLLDSATIGRIMPMPLHPDRLRERGFNQAGEIARALAGRLRIELDTRSLVRTRSTPTQTGRQRKERMRNVRGAFECHADLAGQHILLVDDVMTSGASLNECARVLKLHGAASIRLAVAARAFRD